MVNNEDGYDENFDFDDNKDENSINAILNDQQESKLNILKNLVIILLIVSAGIGVFWGSFVLGKKVFTVSTPQAKQVEEKVKIDEFSEYEMPDEKVLYEIEQIDSNKAKAAQTSGNQTVAVTCNSAPVVVTPAVVATPKVEPKSEIKVVQLDRQPKPIVAPSAPVPVPVAKKPEPSTQVKVTSVQTYKPVSAPPVAVRRIEPKVAPPAVKIAPAPVSKPEVKVEKKVQLHAVVKSPVNPVAVAKVVVKPAPEKVELKPVVSGKKYKVIAGSYSKEENARILESKLKNQGFDVYLSNVNINSVPMWRVQIGVYDKVDQAKSMIIKVKATGNDAFYIQE